MITEEEDKLVIEENEEGTQTVVSSPKRKSRYIIYKPEDGYGMFKIKSESGDPVQELSGSYTSRKLALNALKYWFDHTKESKEAKWDRMFGEEKAPPLKKKEVKVASRDKP
jgi:hypothetical protein